MKEEAQIAAKNDKIYRYFTFLCNFCQIFKRFHESERSKHLTTNEFVVQLGSLGR